MNEKQQVEEMAEYIFGNAITHDTKFKEDCRSIAIDLYNAGYRKRGDAEWIKLRYGKAHLVTHMKCSNCERVETLNYQYKYCPHCGAKIIHDNSALLEVNNG